MDDDSFDDEPFQERKNDIASKREDYAEPLRDRERYLDTNELLKMDHYIGQLKDRAANAVRSMDTFGARTDLWRWNGAAPWGMQPGSTIASLVLAIYDLRDAHYSEIRIHRDLIRFVDEYQGVGLDVNSPTQDMFMATNADARRIFGAATARGVALVDLLRERFLEMLDAQLEAIDDHEQELNRHPQIQQLREERQAIRTNLRLIYEPSTTAPQQIDTLRQRQLGRPQLTHIARVGIQLDEAEKANKASEQKARKEWIASRPARRDRAKVAAWEKFVAENDQAIKESGWKATQRRDLNL